MTLEPWAELHWWAQIKVTELGLPCTCWIDLSLARIRADKNTRYDPGALGWAALVSSDQSGRVRIALHYWIDQIKDDQRWSKMTLESWAELHWWAQIKVTELGLPCTCWIDLSLAQIGANQKYKRRPWTQVGSAVSWDQICVQSRIDNWGTPLR